MNRQELDVELKAIADLNQRLTERIDTLTRRLHRHFDLAPGGGKTDFRLTMTEPRRWPPRMRNDEDDGGD